MLKLTVSKLPVAVIVRIMGISLNVMNKENELK